jgi:hypothetical protein
MNVSAYLNFSIALDYSVTPAKLRLTDTSSYPPGVAAGITGKVEIVQPDEITTPGTFTDVIYASGALTIAQKELRLGTDGHPQNGSYTVVYTVMHDGDTTSYARVFTLNYTEPKLIISRALDVFTPFLKAVDSSSYAVSGLTYQNIVRSWTATVGSVGSASGSSNELNLAVSGNYYDASYSVSLESIVEWDIASYNWVTIFDKILKTVTFTADTPPTLVNILNEITAFKLELDALRTNCAEYETKKANYEAASIIYTNLRERGRRGDLDGLEGYIEEIQKLLNDGITPAYTNTNAIIPPYDWETAGGSGSTAWTSITGKPINHRIQFKIGDPGFPADGATVFTDTRLAGAKIIYLRNGFPQWRDNPGDGDTYYSKDDTGAGSNTMTVSPEWKTGEKILIFTLPL